MDGECFRPECTGTEGGKDTDPLRAGLGHTGTLGSRVGRSQARQFMAAGLTSTYLHNCSHAGCVIFGTWGSLQALRVANLIATGEARQQVGYGRGTEMICMRSKQETPSQMDLFLSSRGPQDIE